MEKRWTQNRLAKELQSAGLNKSRVAATRIEAQMVHVYDFQLLFIAKVLGVAPLDLFPKTQTNRNLHEGAAGAEIAIHTSVVSEHALDEAAAIGLGH